jgi:hypothetical protein
VAYFFEQVLLILTKHSFSISPASFDLTSGIPYGSNVFMKPFLTHHFFTGLFTNLHPLSHS